MAYCLGFGISTEAGETMKQLVTVAIGIFIIFVEIANATTYQGVFYAASGGDEPGLLDSGSAQGGSGGTAVGILSDNNPPSDHAILWLSLTNLVDLNPSGYKNSYALGSDGNQQVGYGGTSGDSGGNEALLWTGSAASYVDLKPSGFSSAIAQATSGTQQVGSGRNSISGTSHALLWSGTAASVIDLNGNSTGSQAYAIDGNQVVGYQNVNNIPHAALWTTSSTGGVTTATVSDLNPSGAASSAVLGTSGVHQVGYAATVVGATDISAYASAYEWAGTEASAVDLNPLGYDHSVATGISGNTIVGWAQLPSTVGYTGLDHAAVWDATNGAFINLNSFIPPVLPGTSTSTSGLGSQAFAVDSNGDIFGALVSNQNPLLYNLTGVPGEYQGYPIEWIPVPVPEPQGLCLAAIFAIVLGVKRRARTAHRNAH
jgi:hypothetical protein